jgi:hypothetical protein
MNKNEVTLVERITRGEMMGEQNTTGNVVSAAFSVKKRLRQRGIPAIGTLGLVAVEWGTLTIEFEAGEGQYNDAWVYTWTGRPVPAGVDLVALASNGRALVIDMPLAAVLTADDEL